MVPSVDEWDRTMIAPSDFCTHLYLDTVMFQLLCAKYAGVEMR